MSWDAYVSNNLMCPVDAAGSTLHSAALLGLDGGVWAKSSQYPNMTTEEVLALGKAFSWNSSSKDPFPSACIIGSLKFIIARIEEEDSVIVARGTGDWGACGFIAAKTERTMVVGIYQEPTTKGPICRKIVTALQEYLKGISY